MLDKSKDLKETFIRAGRVKRKNAKKGKGGGGDDDDDEDED